MAITRTWGPLPSDNPNIQNFGWSEIPMGAAAPQATVAPAAQSGSNPGGFFIPPPVRYPDALAPRAPRFSTGQAMGRPPVMDTFQQWNIPGYIVPWSGKRSTGVGGPGGGVGGAEVSGDWYARQNLQMDEWRRHEEELAQYEAEKAARAKDYERDLALYAWQEDERRRGRLRDELMAEQRLTPRVRWIR